jgi:hypothetical protein
MAFWDAQDTRHLLLKRWLDAYRIHASLTGNEPDQAWRPGDTSNVILAKILRSHCAAYSVPASSQNSFRFGDSSNDLLRKILNVLSAGIGGYSGSEYDYRLNDSNTNILAKILRWLYVDSAATDPQTGWLPGDNEVWCLRKIVGIY